MLGLLVASLLVLAVSVAIALALPMRGSVERTTAALLIAHATVTALLLGAGVLLRALQPSVVAVLAVVWALVVGGVLVRTRAAVTGTVAGGLAAARAAARGRLDLWPWLPVAALALVVFVAYAWRAVIAIQLPVLDYDGFSYHLVTTDVWLQTGEIGRVPQRYWSDGYPANGELLTLWLALFTGSDELATFTSFVAVPLAIVATVGIARRLGASRPTAVLAGLVLAAMPALISLATTTYVDGIAVAYIAAAWFFGLAALGADDGPRRRALLVLTGAAIGLGAGTKASMVLPLAILGLGLLVAEGRRRGARALRGAADAALLVGLPAVLLGGYWYAKNILVFGNPLWPFTIGPLPGIGTFDDLIGVTPPQFVGLGPLEQILRSWFADRALDRYSYGGRLGGFGLEWPLVLVLAVAGVAFLVRGRRFAGLLLLVMPAAITLVVMPMAWWARYTLFVPVVALGLAAVALTRLPRLGGVMSMALVVLATSVSVWVATAHGNAIVEDGKGLPTLSAMIRLVRASPEERHNLGFWRQCASLATIPPGSRVAWDDFNMLHAIAGPRSDRFALEPIVPTSDPADLLRQASELDADYFLLHDDGVSLAAARQEPAAFTVVGPGCLSTQIVAVSPDARPAP